MLETIETALGTLGGIIWGPYVLIPLLLLTGVYLTVRLGGVQFRKLGSALRLALFDRKDEGAEEGDVSQFQALTTALAATVGTGNIVGVATAISVGGPGAVFWMWISALLGMMTKYSEIVLAVRYRETNKNGQYVGGPMYYLKNGVGAKWPKIGAVLGVIFSIFAAFACFGIGNMTQANSIANAFESTFGFDKNIIGIVLAVIVAVVILGGIKSIAR